MEKNRDFKGRHMNGKSPICIENKKIKKPRKSQAEEFDKEKTDFFGNAKFSIFLRIGDFPFENEFFLKTFQPPT